MPLMSRALLVILALGLASCGLDSANYLKNRAQVSGNDFNSCLIREYDQLTYEEVHVDQNWVDSDAFAETVQRLIAGERVMPRNPEGYGVSPRRLAELREARVRLMDALDNGGRTQRNRACACARAQRFYDGWVEQASDNKFGVEGSSYGGVGGTVQPSRLRADRNAFFEALIACETGSGSAITKSADNPSVFSVYFRSGSASLDRRGHGVVDQAARSIQASGAERSVSVRVTGYSDSSGDPTKNIELSRDRAKAVAAALKSRGVNRVSVRWRGEESQAIRTRDNAAEPLNRRVEIQID